MSYPTVTALPRSISYFANRLSNFSRNRVKLNMITSTSATTGSIVTVALPPNSLIDLDSLALFMTITTGTNTTVSSIEDVIHSLQVEIGGKIVDIEEYFNQTAALWNDYQAGKSQIRQVLTKCPTGNAIASVVNTATNGAVKAIFNFPGFLGTVQPRVLDSGKLGEVRLSFRIGGNEVLVASTTTPTLSLSLSNISWECDVLMVDDSYHQIVNAKLNNGDVLELPFQRVVPFIGAPQSLNGATMSFSINTQSLDALIGTCYQSTWKGSTAILVPSTASIETDGESAAVGYVMNPYFARGSANLTGSQFQINSMSYPSYGLTSPESSFVYTQNALVPIYAGANVGLDSMTEYKQFKFANCVRLNMPDDNRLISGLNTNSSNTQIVWSLAGSTDTVVPAVFAVTTSSLLVGAGQQVQVNY